MVKSITKRKGLLVVGASLLALQAAPAFAQDSKKDEPVTVEDVVVTAQRRVEANIDVPIAITAIGAEEIQNIGAGYMTDIGFKAPNVFMSGGSISPSISIRGVSSQSNINAGFPPAVGVYVDEVYQGRDPTFNTILNDVERVEVLRGPQGTLYGKNTIGGAINITTTQPSNDFTAFGDVNFGNLGLFQARATIGGALVEDKLMARVSIVHRERDGWLTNALTGEKLNDLESNGGRIVLASQITEKLRFTFSADTFKETGTSALETGPVTLSSAVPSFSVVPVQNPNDNVVQLNSPEFAERNLYGFSGRFDYDMDGMALTSITAYRQYSSDFNDDSDGLQLDAFNVGREENAENFSQEFRLASTGEDRLTWLVGAYFYVENIENNRRIVIGPDMPKLLGGPAAGIYWPGYTGEVGRTASTIESSSWALFGSSTYAVTERVHAALGLRWTHEEKDFAYSQLTPVLYTAGLGGSIARQFAVLINPRTEAYSDERLTGDVSLSYDFNDDAVGYVKYSRGFKAGGFQTDVISPPFSPADDFGFKPETVNNYEMGLKSYLFARRVSLNAAIFYLDWKDKQEQIFTGLSFLIRNAATATSRGAELEITARPTRALTLDANLAYLDTRYDEFPGSTLAGKHFPGLPEWSGSAGIQYIAPLSGSLELFARADVIYRGDTYTQPNSTSTQVNEALTTFNGRLGIQSDEGGWGVYAWGKNLTDEIVVGSGSAFPFPFASITTRSPGFGKTYGVELRKKF